MVEFAIVSPVLILLLFGIIEFGRMLMVQQVLTNASREGARRAIVERATATEVETVTKTYLASNSVKGVTVTVSPGALSSVGFGDPVTVACSVPFASVSWLPSPWFMDGATLSAQSVMSADRPE